ncbi:oxidoreductase [Novosphingobium sp. TH158]|uniref:oxidoreductase n=1 Tax=Novosphingobium sp. TH158 TaxID=2067455 RepID=UPI000C7BDE5C|nr:oxidoreductase [Novosphingobium sp. TH158]PLK25573.1 oxidoreductase [Novosphingobium sp. TH158]
MSGFTEADVPSQQGRTIIVTGSNTGIGFEAARALAAKGARVLLACRSRDKAEAAMARIGAVVPGADLAFLPLDQSDLASVRKAADLAAREARLDVLLNNAGVMMPPLSLSAQGLELQFATNHLGTFALTGLLLPKLAETAGSRVVITASLAHKRGRIDFGNLDAGKGYGRGRFYAQSKLANILHMFELDRRLRAAGSPVTAVGCHPGVAASELVRHIPMGNAIGGWLLSKFLNSSAKGAWPALQAATDPAVQGGSYWGPQLRSEMAGPSGPASRSAGATDAAVARQLWDRSIELSGVDPGLPPAD